VICETDNANKNGNETIQEDIETNEISKNTILKIFKSRQNITEKETETRTN
jgi:hypothetical protein